jgi:Type II secretion system (T2SS), protein M subtype b
MAQTRMMLELPTGARGRVVALSLPAIVLLVLLLGVIMPLVDYWRSVDAEYTQLFNKNGAYERLASRKDAMAKQVRALETELAQAVDYLPKGEPAMAAAKVQADLGQLAERSGAVVRSTLTLPIKAEDGFTAVGFQLNVTGSMRAIRDVLYEIETGHPRLVIDRVTITPAPESGENSGPDDVDMSVDLHGYMIGEIEQ